MAFEESFVRVVGTDPLVQGLVGGLVIAISNLFGAALVLVYRDPSKRLLDGAMGFAAGVMLTAAFTSLILPGIEHPAGGLVQVLVGIALGALLLDQADRWVPHVHVLVSRPGARGSHRDGRLGGLGRPVHRRDHAAQHAGGTGCGGRLRVRGCRQRDLADARHRPSERAGGARGVDRGCERRVRPPLLRGPGRRPGGTGRDPVGRAWAAAVSIATPILPYAMGFAAGGMLFVISDEIIPETHVRGHERAATAGTMVGTLVMLTMDVALG
jgi:ZIP family zinc transporter